MYVGPIEQAEETSQEDGGQSLVGVALPECEFQAQITCVVVTPEQMALDAKVDLVVLPLYDGEIGDGLVIVR